MPVDLTREDAIAWLNGLAAKDRLEPIEIGGLISMALALVDQPTRLAAARAEGYREGVAKERERCIQIVGGRIMAARLGELDADLRSIGKSVLHTIRTPTTEEGA